MSRSLPGLGSYVVMGSHPPPAQELLHKMKGRGFPWSRLLLILLVFAAGFLLHDVRTHGSFQGKAVALLHAEECPWGTKLERSPE